MDKKEFVEAERLRVRKERQKFEKNDAVIFDLTGCRGRSMKVYQNRCVISTDVTLGSILTSNATDGQKTIFYYDVVGVQYKPSRLTIGYIQLETAAGQMNNLASNMFSENTFTFDGNTDEIFEAKEYILHQVAQYKVANAAIKAGLSTMGAESVLTYVQNRQTADEMIIIQSLDIAKSGYDYELKLQIQHNDRIHAKAILATLQFKDIFDQLHTLKNVHFIFEATNTTPGEVVSSTIRCRISEEYFRSLANVEVLPEKVVYFEGPLDEWIRRQEEIAARQKEIAEQRAAMASAGNIYSIETEKLREFQSAKQMHEYVMNMVQECDIVLSEEEIAQLSKVVRIERMYGNAASSYIRTLKELQLL